MSGERKKVTMKAKLCAIKPLQFRLVAKAVTSALGVGKKCIKEDSSI